jgi:O-antigen ligase
MIISIGFSLLANAKGADQIGRFVILIIHVLNVVIVWPVLMASSNGENLRTSLSWAFCVLSSAVLVLAMYYHLAGVSPYFRLGYPLIPGVFAYMLAAAAIVALLQLRRPELFAVFAFGVFLSGSRTSAAFLVGFVVVYILIDAGKTIKRGRMPSALAVTGLLIIAAGLYVVQNAAVVERVARPFLVERVDPLSGRGEIWSEAVEAVRSRPILGYGERMTFGASGSGLLYERVAHNAFLDLVLSYGFISMILALAFWLSIVWAIVRRPDIRPIARSPVAWLILLVFLKAMFSNIFWTNLGDPVTYFVLLMCLSAIYSARSERWFGAEVSRA